MPRFVPRSARTIAALGTAAVVAAACGSSSQTPSASAHPGATASTQAGAGSSAPVGQAPTTKAATPVGPAGPVVSTAVSVPGSGTYSLAVKANTGSGPCTTPHLAGKNVPFTVSVTNTGSAPAPEARLHVAITDPQATGKPVAAIAYQGLCLDFTEPGGTLAPGQTATYDGTASGVTSAASLTATIISTPDNNQRGQVTTPLG